MKQYLYGKQPVMARLMNRKTINHLYVSEGPALNQIISLAHQAHIPVTFANKKALDRMVNQVHQGVVAEIPPYETVPLQHILRDQLGLIVLLDGVEDPHNLGAILRTCDSVGVDGVIVKKHRSAPLTSTVAKVSAGAIETVPVVEVTNLVQTIQKLKQAGYWIVGTDMEQASYYRSFDYTIPVVLVVGSEGTGISRLVKQHCDMMAQIPMVGSVSSLNVSVATSVLLYEIMHQRGEMKR